MGASVESTLSSLESDAERGLTRGEANKRLRALGPNTIEQQQKSLVLQFLSYFWGPIPWMLEAACLLSGLSARYDELFVASHRERVHAQQARASAPRLGAAQHTSASAP